MSKLQDIINKTILEAGLSKTDALELYDMFFADFPNTKISIEENILKEIYTSILGDAHKLKGLAANLRISEVNELASELISAAKNNNSEDCTYLIQKISDIIL